MYFGRRVTSTRPLRRNQPEAFADVLADLRHGAATERARRLNDLPHEANEQASGPDCDDRLDPIRRAIGPG